MVLHASVPRRITLERAREILETLPPFVTAVGLFVDCPTADILQISRALGLRHVQLHGHEPPEMIAELRPLAVIKAVRVQGDLATEGGALARREPSRPHPRNRRHQAARRDRRRQRLGRDPPRAGCRIVS
jgi:phosphoribosylanthranilate isomerase